MGAFPQMGVPGVPSPSTVMTSAPSKSVTLARQERVALPFTTTVQAPHWPLRSQDCLTPVSLRSSHNRSRRTRFWWTMNYFRIPLIVNVTSFIDPPLKGEDSLREASPVFLRPRTEKYFLCFHAKRLSPGNK